MFEVNSLPSNNHETAMFTTLDTDQLLATLNRFAVPMFAAERPDQYSPFRILCTNSAHVRATGLKGDDVAGLRLEEFLPPEDARNTEERYALCIQTDDVINYHETLRIMGRLTRWDTTLQPVNMPGTRQRIIGTALSMELNADPAEVDDTEFFAAQAQMQIGQMQQFLDWLEVHPQIPAETRDHALMINGLARSLERVLLDLRLATQRRRTAVFQPQLVPKPSHVVPIRQLKTPPLSQSQRSGP